MTDATIRTHNRLLADVWTAWRPPPALRAVEWIPRNIRIPDVTETPGDFDLDRVPHVRGFLELIDDPLVRRIYLRWATRNTKTTSAIAALIYLVANTGRPAMLGSVDEDRVDDTSQNLLYPYLEECAATRTRLLPEHRRNKREILVGSARIRRVFAGSRSSLAGFPAAYGLANEVALWPMNMVQRFVQRAKLFSFDSKLIFEGKPEEKGRCTITALVESETTDRRHYHARCPHCGTYQRLVFGDAQPESPGLKWNKPAKGHSDPVLAQATAWYRCVEGCRCTDADRPAMMRAGVWLSEGLSIDRRGRITGTPRIVSENVALDELSTLYSLLIGGWGQIVAEWFDCKDNPEARREFITGTLCKVWDDSPPVVQAHELAERLKSDVRRGSLTGGFVTLAADVGVSAEELIFYWLAVAWNESDGTGHVVDWGFAQSVAELDRVAERLQPVRWGLDSGGGRDVLGDRVTERVYDICRSRRHCWPLKGSSASLGADWYREGFQHAGAKPRELRQKKRHGLGDLLIVNTALSQSWRESLVRGSIKPTQRGFVTLPVEVSEQPELYRDFLDELTSDFQVEGRWERRGPNEYGDALRYCRVLAELATRGGRTWGTAGDVASQSHGPVRSSVKWFSR